MMQEANHSKAPPRNRRNLRHGVYIGKFSNVDPLVTIPPEEHRIVSKDASLSDLVEYLHDIRTYSWGIFMRLIELKVLEATEDIASYSYLLTDINDLMMRIETRHVSGWPVRIVGDRKLEELKAEYARILSGVITQLAFIHKHIHEVPIWNEEKRTVSAWAQRRNLGRLLRSATHPIRSWARVLIEQEHSQNESEYDRIINGLVVVEDNRGEDENS